MSEILIKNGEIYDGTEKAHYVSNIYIKDGKIEKIGKLENANAEKIIEADGLCVFPGFIDSHTHTDIDLINRPDRHEAVMQGVTCEVTGSCGIGILPMDNTIGGYLGSVRGIVGELKDKQIFSDIKEYTTAVGKTGVNYAIQAAHSPIRAKALGFCDVPIGQNEIKRLCSLLEEQLKDGACAFSTGLSYYPASFCDTSEVIELCKVAKKYDVPFTIHLRSVKNKFFEGNFDATAEAIRICEESGVHLHFSHRRTTTDTVGMTNNVVLPIEDGIKRGLDITADFYPYPVGCGYIAVFLPLWVMNGDTEAVLHRICDKSLRKIICSDMEKNNPNMIKGVFIDSEKHGDYLGKSFAEVAKQNGQSISEMLLDFLIDERLGGGYRLMADFDEGFNKQIENDFAELIKKPYYMVGSDTLPEHRLPHPRSFGTFSKMLRIAREHSIPLEIMANRLCKNPAKLFGMSDRGVIKEGAFADITIFDRATVGEIASFKEPMRYPVGIKYVLVNGEMKVSDGKVTNVLSGQFIKP